MMKLRGNKKGVSPVVATIIIVAVAICVSIVVAYWVTSIVPAFTRFEPDPQVEGLTQKTFNLGDEIYAEGYDSYLFHGFIDNSLVIGHYDFEGFRTTKSNLYVRVNIDKEFRLMDRTFTIKNFDFYLPSITLEWI